MFIIIDKTTNKIIQTIDKNYGIQVGENQPVQEITSQTLADKINSAYDYTLVFDTNGKVIDINVTKTIEEYQQEQLSNIENVKQLKYAELSQACQNAIIGGFTSTAYQNTSKVYDSNLEDQANITGNALSAVSKVAGVPDCQNDKFYYRAHGEDFTEWTAEECLQLARDFKSFKEQQLIKNKELQAYVAMLAGVKDVQKITWNSVVPTA